MDFTDGVYDFAERCDVGMGEACDRAGIAPSTPPRWRRGHRPRPRQVSRLRRAIIDISRERGQLPAELLDGPPSPSLLQRVQRIVAEAQAVEAELIAAARDAAE